MIWLSESIKCMAVFVVVVVVVVVVVFVFGLSTCGDQNHPQANEIYDNRYNVHPNLGMTFTGPDFTCSLVYHLCFKTTMGGVHE